MTLGQQTSKHRGYYTAPEPSRDVHSGNVKCHGYTKGLGGGYTTKPATHEMCHVRPAVTYPLSISALWLAMYMYL